jgi:phosphate transport system substrate-binding protein
MKWRNKLTRWIIISIGFFTTQFALATTEITGAGATFPYPVYAKWAEAYKTATGVSVNYQTIGSGGGIKQIQAKTVDFGASDKPLSPTELQQSGLLQFPTVMGGVVLVVNLANIKPGQLKVSGAILGDIYLGKIKRWNDPALAKLNPGITLPDQAISVVHRSDGSGTTFLFTNYLGKVNNNWQQQVGSDAAVAWPTGVGGKGNEGVAAYVQRIKGAIGYVEFAYAQQNQMTYLQLQNKSGNFVTPSTATFKAAAASADWQHAPGFYEILTDVAGKESWPITGATFILLPKQSNQPEHAKAVLQFFAWAYQNGDAMALALNYIPLPKSVVSLIENHWRTDIKDTNNKPVWK